MSTLDVYPKGNWAGRLEEALDGLVFAYNEWFCMRLASACGHDVAGCDVLPLCGERYYVTTRYDRVDVSGVTKSLGLNEKVMRTILSRQRSRILRQTPRLTERLGRIHPSAVYGRIADGIAQRCAQLDSK